MYVVKAAETTLVQKMRTLNVDEIDTSMKRQQRSIVMIIPN
jgi:hypothetical protein